MRRSVNNFRILQFRICPMCNKENSVSLMPLQKNEAYRISLEDKRGLDIQFLKLKTWRDAYSGANPW